MIFLIYRGMSLLLAMMVGVTKHDTRQSNAKWIYILASPMNGKADKKVYRCNSESSQYPSIQRLGDSSGRDWYKQETLLCRPFY